MRIITIPPLVKMPIGVINPQLVGPDKDVTFFEWLAHSLDMYLPLGKGGEMIMKAVNIHSILKKAEDAGSSTLTYEESDFEIVDRAIQEMSWKAGYARRVVSFYDAMKNAQKVETPQGK